MPKCFDTMMRTINIPLMFFCVVLLSFSVQGQESWSVSFKGIGTFSSPRVTDLNGDGIGDIILGAGREEFKACDSAVMALNGRNGKLMWRVSAIDQVFGSASLKDINGDKVMDVIISGRSSELIAINGRNGKVLWRFNKTTGGAKWFNFYNSQFIPDQDNDGLDDILNSNGGDVMVASHDPNRAAGHMVVISTKTGKLIAKAMAPDKREIYTSIAAVPTPDKKDFKVLFGTGGETVAGNLYVTTLSAILKGDISNAVLLDASPKNGYVAPPMWADITHDGIPDIIANAVEGKLLAFDGNTYAPLWSVKIPGTEAYSSIAAGYFTEDKTLDFFVSYAVGVWPKLEWSRQAMVDGRSGEIKFTDSLGFYQTSTPVVMNLDGDEQDEAIISVNVESYDETKKKQFNNMLMAIDFRTHELVQLSETEVGSNISTTPWIGDMDGDGMLDIVYCSATNPVKPYTFDGMRVSRMVTQVPITTKIKWGSYMGSNYDGVYPADK
jgi:outer membrane protein assembly factor BamB